MFAKLSLKEESYSWKKKKKLRWFEVFTDYVFKDMNRWKIRKRWFIALKYKIIRMNMKERMKIVYF